MSKRKAGWVGFVTGSGYGSCVERRRDVMYSHTHTETIGLYTTTTTTTTFNLNNYI